jgi:sialate O-acetylesterase
MIAPLVPFAIRGVVWYQGESNTSRPLQYRRLFPAMIKNWRHAWGRDDLPFLFVQLAPFEDVAKAPQESEWAELREAQLMTFRSVPRTGMAVITDLGEPDELHPRRKEPVAARLVLAARALVYGETLEYSGPIYDHITVQGNKVIISFKHLGGGLVARGPLEGFTIAGEDRHFVNADAEIEGDHVVVWSPQVSNPIAVRFGWADYPVGNLWNRAGLPASPFRSDSFSTTKKHSMAPGRPSGITSCLFGRLEHLGDG